MASRLSYILIALWAGALWSTGMSAYVLFDTLQDKQLAGSLAGKLFNVVTYIGFASAFYLLIHRLAQFGTTALKQSFFWVVFVMLLLVLAGHFGIQPILESFKSRAFPLDVMQSVFANRFRNWHGVASLAYVFECLLAIVMVLKVR